MNRKNVIRKIAVLTAWLLVCCGMIVLMAAANRKQGRNLCKRVVVSIKGDEKYLFIEKGDILQQLKTAAKGSLVNKPVVDIQLAQLEKELEKHQWIRDAELYFDTRDALHVSVTEKEPIARVFTTTGTSFYVDSAGKRMPLLEKVTVRLPVVTNFPSGKRLNKKDSLLLRGLTAVVQYIAEDLFWKAQIAQIDITPAGTFEAIPVVGNHIIRLGTAEGIENKLRRLFIFYKQVLSKAGFDKYDVLDVQYEGQVVAINKSSSSPVDSIQLQKNIQELVEKSRLRMVEDSITTEKIKELLKEDTATKESIALWKEAAEKEKEKAEAEKKKAVKINVKKEKRAQAKNVAKPKAKQGMVKTKIRKPKAVLAKKENDY